MSCDKEPQLKKELVSCLLSEKESRMLSKLSTSKGVSRSEWIRQAITEKIKRESK